jgi:hypothetical protein
MLAVHEHRQLMQRAVHRNAGRIGGHDHPHVGQLWVLPPARDPQSDVAISENATQLAMFLNHEASDITLLQQLTGLRDAFLWSDGDDGSFAKPLQ